MPKTYSQVGPVARALELLGERWTILVLQELLRGYHRFNDLMDAVQGITSSVLSARLKVLEGHGVISRKFYTEHPPRADYHLTRKGHELGVVAGAMAVWATRHFPDPSMFVHNVCGDPIDVAYFCRHCEHEVRGAEVELIIPE